MPTQSLPGDFAKWSACRPKKGRLSRKFRARARKNCGKQQSVVKRGLARRDAARESLRRARRWGSDERGSEGPRARIEGSARKRRDRRQKVLRARGISRVR